MNTFWLKVAAVVVVVVGLVIVVNAFWPSESEPAPKPPPKTVYDVWDRDEKRLRADPEPNAQEPPAVENTQEPEPEPKFKELSLEKKVQAEKLFEMALFHRKKGRLPMMGYKNMVDYCRQIIQRWPDSVYAFKARRMLRDIPPRYRKVYHITNEEMGL